MRLLCPAALMLALAPAPAFATSSIHCRTEAGARGPDIWLVVPNEPGAGITGARIVHRGREIVVGTAGDGPRIAQSALNERRLSLRIIYRGAMGTMMRLTASRHGTPYTGLVAWQGGTWPVRCYWDEDDEG